ncbi:MAG: NAD-dependent epimerase/dehydratase family protein [Candidatus Omnitrophica bacterium]|nr:NAD-dependent epimerase/dehydratase family protein [Candidatus Omnitrophota bacterium]
MKTLVTGAPGWLGTALVEALCASNRAVRCLVHPRMDATTLKPYPVEVVAGDVTLPASLGDALKEIEVVYHCAGIIHPHRIRDLYRLNRDGTRSLLEASVAAGTRKFIFVSSNAAQGYNISRDRLLTEADPCHPVSHYGQSKYEAEQIVTELGKRHGVATVIIRPPVYYGPRQPERMIMVMRLMRQGRSMIFGDGLNLRSMAYIDNVVQGLLLAEERAPSGSLYWIADERPYTTVEVLQTMARLLQAPFTPLRLPAVLTHVAEAIDRGLGVMNRYAMGFHVLGEAAKDSACSIAKAQTELGYHPQVALEEGMRRSIAWAHDRGLL